MKQALGQQKSSPESQVSLNYFKRFYRNESTLLWLISPVLNEMEFAPSPG
jgi:hypothetical protein